MTVHFDELDEFMIELERDALDDEVQHKIVRRVVRREGNEVGSAWKVSTVVAYMARGQVVECIVRRGDLPFGPSIDAQTMSRLEVDRKAIEEFCAQHGLDLRGGAFQ